MVISSGKATLHELQAVYSLNHVYQLQDIIYTENYNNEMVHKNNKAIEKQKARK